LYLLHIKLAQLACFVVHGRGNEVMWHWHKHFDTSTWKPFRSWLGRS
jgi:hypothetical protein